MRGGPGSGISGRTRVESMVIMLFTSANNTIANVPRKFGLLQMWFRKGLHCVRVCNGLVRGT